MKNVSKGSWKRVENMAGAAQAKMCCGYSRTRSCCGLVNHSQADSFVPLVSSNLTAFANSSDRTVTY